MLNKPAVEACNSQAPVAALALRRRARACAQEEVATEVALTIEVQEFMLALESVESLFPIRPSLSLWSWQPGTAPCPDCSGYAECRRETVRPSGLYPRESFTPTDGRWPSERPEDPEPIGVSHQIRVSRAVSIHPPVNASSSPGQGTVIRLVLTFPTAAGDDAMNGLRSEVRVRRRAEYQRDVRELERSVRASTDTNLQEGRSELDLEGSLVPVSCDLCLAADEEAPRDRRVRWIAGGATAGIGADRASHRDVMSVGTASGRIILAHGPRVRGFHVQSG